MKMIKEVMSNAGFDYDNPEGLEGTKFIAELAEYKQAVADYEALEDEQEKEDFYDNLTAQEVELVEVFKEEINVEDDPEVEELKRKEAEAAKRAQEAEERAAAEAAAKEEADKAKAEAEAKAQEAEARAKEREAKLEEIENKAKLEQEEKLFLLNNKRKLDFKEMAKLGIDAEEAPRKFEWNGYVFEQRWMFKEYVILSRPKG